MDLLWLALGGFAMIAVVFTVGVVIQVLFDRRFGVPHRRPDRGGEQLTHHASRSALGGFGPGGGAGS
ncbi:hypothetical protein [Amnibacterium kyonggiense]|uniref:Uncharacterized protein n=1 Tax=Amnibacterium kyonggiense TaxID=595671 RepID=A0A4R7FFZ1_9MICO|nr:hypothetical protein [Amnibacterium kyonggiense]TDS75810.1 hypothetical protein CLV52_2919 [Amnibacterium kyonggiense]